MKNLHEVNNQLKEKVVDKFKEGLNHKKASKSLTASQATAPSIISKWKECGTTDRPDEEFIQKLQTYIDRKTGDSRQIWHLWKGSFKRKHCWKKAMKKLVMKHLAADKS